MNKFLVISEEYGCQMWYAILSEVEFEKLSKRWKTIKGLNCLVPINFIIEGAKPLVQYDFFSINFDNKKIHLIDVENFFDIVECHIHQSDDSFIEGVDYGIPEGNFEIDGKVFSDEEVEAIFHQYSDDNLALFEEPNYVEATQSKHQIILRQSHDHRIMD
jgi:hypothetical protein